MFKQFAVALIAFYQNFLSPLKAPSCRFFPSCSSYTRQAIEKYGVLKGALLGLFRICRCHPLHPGGYDPLK